MIAHGILIACFLSPMSIDQACQLTRARHAAMDRMRVSLHSLTYISTNAESRNDAGTWQPTENIIHLHTLTILRPNLIHDWLTDQPLQGYEPVRNSLCDGRFVRQWVRPLSTGETKYHVDETTTHVAPFTWLPILWVFDLQLPDALTPSLTTLDVLEHPTAQVLGVVDGCTRFHADIRSPGGGAFVLRCDVDLNERATPMRFTVTVDYDDEALESGVWELTTNSVVEFHDVELPMVATVMVQNPNVSTGAGIHRFEVATFEEVPTLAHDDIAIVPSVTNSVVTTRSLTPYDHQVTVRYDSQGVATEHTETYGLTDAINSPRTASAPASFWQVTGSTVAGLTSLCAACLFGSRRWRIRTGG